MARSLSLKLTQEAARALACEAAAAFQGRCRSASHRTSVGHRADALEKIRRGFASEAAAARTDNTARKIRIRLWSAEAPGTKPFSSQVGKRLGSDVLERLKTQFGKPVPAARELAKQTLQVPSRVARTAQLQVEGIWQQNKWLFIGTFTLVVVYALWRSMFRVASSFINLSETFAEYGFLAFAMALATLGYLIISHRYKIRPSNVYRIAMIRLNSHPGVLEVLGAPVIGSELRAYVLVGGGLKFKNFRLKLRPRRLHMIFPVEGRDHRGMASLEVKKRRGRYDFKLLAVDVPGAEGSKPIFVYGDMDRYNRGGVLAELRDPFLKALDMSGATEAEDEADDLQDSAAEAEEDRGRHADLPKPLDQGGGMYFYEQVWEALHKAFARSLQALQKKKEQLSK